MRSGEDWGRVSNCVADEFNVFVYVGEPKVITPELSLARCN